MFHSLILYTIFRAIREDGDVVRSVNRNQDNKKITSYHRLLMGVAFFDILLSVGLAFGPFLQPTETEFPYAFGNQKSCTFQSFLLTLGLAGTGYSACLMFYYLLVIRYNLKERTIARWFEPIFHFVPLVFHTSIAIGGIFLEVYNPQLLRCWVATYPPDCEAVPEMECSRGEEYAHLFGAYLLIIPSSIYILSIILILAFLGLTVWQQYRRQRRFSFASSNTGMSKEMMQLTITQCFLYGFAFLFVFGWGTAATFLIDGLKMEYDALGEHFWLTATANTLYPMQGVFFSFIFFRPRYISIRQKYPALTRWRALCRAINHSAESSSRVSSRLSNANAPAQRVEISAHDMKRRVENNSHDTSGASGDAFSSKEQNHEDNQQRQNINEECNNVVTPTTTNFQDEDATNYIS